MNDAALFADHARFLAQQARPLLAVYGEGVDEDTGHVSRHLLGYAMTHGWARHLANRACDVMCFDGARIENVATGEEMWDVAGHAHLLPKSIAMAISYPSADEGPF